MPDAITGLDHIALLVSDRESSLRFYQTLGFVLAASHPRPERGDEILMLRGHGVTLELFAAAGRPPRVTRPEAYGLRHLALHTADVSADVRLLEAAGYRPEPIRRDTFSGARMTFVADPDGLPIELHE